MAKQNINWYEDSKFQVTNALIASEFLNLFYISLRYILSDTKTYSTESKERR